VILSTLIILFILLTAIVNGQDFRDLETFDDIFQAYNANEIDYDLFLLLLENMEGNLMTVAEFDAAVREETADSGSGNESCRNGRLWSRYCSDRRVRIGHSERFFADHKPKRKAFLSYAKGGFSAMTELSSEGSRVESGKRNLTFAGSGFTIKVGNYYIDEGSGLAIGKFDYLPSAGFPDSAAGDYIHPLNGCYNGLLIKAEKTASSIGLYLSQKKYLKAVKNFAGAGGNLKVGGNSIGVNCGYNHFAHDSAVDRRAAVGINLKRRGERSAVNAELAGVDGSPGLYGDLNLKFPGFAIRTTAWGYAAGFKNYNCSGVANDDYRSFYPAAQKIGFRSAQAGESGFGIGGGTKMAKIEMQSWWPAPSKKYHLLVRGSLKTSLMENLVSVTSFNFSTIRSGLRFWLKSRFEFGGIPILRCLGFRGYFLEGSGIDNQKSYFVSEMAIGELGQRRLFFRNRNFLDGNSDLLLCCDIYLWRNLYLGAEFNFRRDFRGNARVEGYF